MAYSNIIRSKIAEMDKFEKKIKSIPFINDELDSGLNAVLVTVHLALMNQQIKAGSTIKFYMQVPHKEDYKTSISEMKEFRVQCLSLCDSLTSIISSSSLEIILGQLVMNDKELLTTLLNASELELRLIHNLTFVQENVGGEIASNVDDIPSNVHQPFNCRKSDSTSTIDRSTSTEFSSNSSNSSNNSSSSNSNNCISSCDDIDMKRLNGQLLHQLKEIRLDSMSSFFLFLSCCINYDASLFFDYLCSPETSALKYVLRITKKLLGFQRMFSSQFMLTSFYKNKMRKKWSPRCGQITVKKQRNTELVMICTNIIQTKKIDVNGNGEKSAKIRSYLFKKNIFESNGSSVPTALEEECNNTSTIVRRFTNDNNDTVHKTVVWLKYEKQVILDDFKASASFVDETLWGCAIEKSQIIQNIHPSEWAREKSQESGESEIRNRGSLEGEDGKKRKRCERQGWPLSSNDNDENDNNDDEDGRAINMYDSIQDFFVKLQILLLQGQKNNGSIPFDCTLLVHRIKNIILLIVMS